MNKKNMADLLKRIKKGLSRTSEKESEKESPVKTEKSNKGETAVADGPMKDILEKSGRSPEVEDLVEGPVIAVEGGTVYVDLHPFGVGIIYGLEYMNARDVIKKINIGDIVKAKVVEKEN